jgi:flagellar biosynthesis protein FliQ
MQGGQDLLDLVSQAFTLAIVIAAPILGAGVAIGLVISVIQSITSIQEQTLTFVPKILAMLIVAIALMSWIAERLITFTAQMLTFV